jgi:hypothetical protein
MTITQHKMEAACIFCNVIWEVARPTTTTQHKMEDACIFCNVIEIFGQRKLTKIEK